MESKHTPGPWVCEVSSCNSIEVCDENQNYVAEVVASNDEDLLDQSNWSNAQLIAAAPDLLEACQAFMSLFNESDMRPEDESYELADIVRAAITKATGGCHE